MLIALCLMTAAVAACAAPASAYSRWVARIMFASLALFTVLVMASAYVYTR